MKVFVAFVDYHADRHTIGAFSTRELAVAAIDANPTFRADWEQTRGHREKQAALGRPAYDPHDIEELELDGKAP